MITPISTAATTADAVFTVVDCPGFDLPSWSLLADVSRKEGNNNFISQAKILALKR